LSDDVLDFVIIDADISKLPPHERQGGRLILINDRVVDWWPDRWNSKYFFFGFPSTHAAVDYTAEEIHNAQCFFAADYVGPSVSMECHELRFANPMNVSAIDGMSGSPVFCMPHSFGGSAQIYFCGMLLRGTVNSGRAHFLDSRVLAESMAFTKITPNQRLQATVTSGLRPLAPAAETHR